ncbi:hypothetical protein [Pseudoalteromonas sp. MMG005]|uniref:hypothetical protein n=1 Tax=Pseudoalteromonas sp. MMG005 TaxID=2822682 RepID=UPI001B3A3431|nr:hypothetical protein [Pseudoalteromonas sp. MMG005]MBQ4847588.1 hypothetical protein [Pseudoalteromonas sp. MMG005]
MVKLSIVSALMFGTSSLPALSFSHPTKVFSDEYVTQTVDWISQEGIQCGQNTHAMCDTTHVEFNDGAHDPARVDSRQTVLVLDSGMDLASVLRYRSRIKAHYSYDVSSQTFVESNPSVAISKLGKKLLTELDQFQYTDFNTQQQKPGFLASAWLRDLALAYGAAAPADTADHVTGVTHFSHGSKVLGYLAQHNPRAEFVLIDTASFLPLLQHTSLVCDKDHDALSSYMQTAASSLRTDVIDEHGVEYVNYSGGFTRSHVQQAWQQNECSGSLSDSRAKKLLESLKPVYQTLFESPKTLGIQSGKRDTSSNADALDVIEYVNRIRVQPYTTETFDTNVSVYGDSGWQHVFDKFKSEFDGNQSIDMYVNFGYGRVNFFQRNQTPKMTSDMFGMQYAPDWALLSSSWAAPVVTSHAINTQSKVYEVNPHAVFSPNLLKNQLISYNCYNYGGYYSWSLYQFIRNGSNQCRIQDPLKHRSDELNRLGYLAQ